MCARHFFILLSPLVKILVPKPGESQQASCWSPVLFLDRLQAAFSRTEGQYLTQMCGNKSEDQEYILLTSNIHPSTLGVHQTVPREEFGAS